MGKVRVVPRMGVTLACNWRYQVGEEMEKFPAWYDDGHGEHGAMVVNHTLMVDVVAHEVLHHVLHHLVGDLASIGLDWVSDPAPVEWVMDWSEAWIWTREHEAEDGEVQSEAHTAKR